MKPAALGLAGAGAGGQRDVLRQKLRAVYAEAAAVGAEPGQLARLAGASVEQVIDLLAEDSALQSELIADFELRQLRGETLRAQAVKLMEACLRKLQAAVDDDQLDVDELSDLLPRLGRLAEHRDRIEEGRNAAKVLPVVHIHISGASTQLSVVKPLDVIDAELAGSADDLEARE